VATILIIFVRIIVPNFLQFKKQRQYGHDKATPEYQDRRWQSPHEAESLWPQSSDDSKQGKQTVTTETTTT